MTATFDPTDDTWRHVLTRDDWPDLLSAAVRRAALTLPTAVYLSAADFVEGQLTPAGADALDALIESLASFAQAAPALATGPLPLAARTK